MSRPERHPNGFTLLELMIVLTIMGGLSLLGVHYFKPGKTANFAAMTQDLVSTLVTARTNAFLNRGPVAFRLDVASGRYETDGVKAATLPEGVRITFVTAQDQTQQTNGAITFFPTGGATGGRIGLRGAKGQSAEITVDWLTGAITHAP